MGISRRIGSGCFWLAATTGLLFSSGALATNPIGSVVVAEAATPTSGCVQPAPDTATGFTQMFAALPVSQWGAADVALSAPLRDGRSVWMYGDTFSTNRFVHSTAITQDKGCLHVSHSGAQLLPNDMDTTTVVHGRTVAVHHIYWIDKAAETGDEGLISITARMVTITPVWNEQTGRVDYCPWCFADDNKFRIAYATVSATGDVDFISWGPIVPNVPPTAPLLNCEAPNPATPHHYCYAQRKHPEFKLNSASGMVLQTTCQNWDDGIIHPFADYRPLFSKVAP